MDKRIARRMAIEQEAGIDWRYVKFNLTTAEGQQGYKTHLLEEFEQWPYHAEDWAGTLSTHERSQVFDSSHYWFAEAIVRKVLNLGDPGPWKRGDRLGRPEHVDLYI